MEEDEEVKIIKLAKCLWKQLLLETGEGFSSWTDREKNNLYLVVVFPEQTPQIFLRFFIQSQFHGRM